MPANAVTARRSGEGEQAVPSGEQVQGQNDGEVGGGHFRCLTENTCSRLFRCLAVYAEGH